MGGGEPDRRSWPSVTLDRRAFLRRSGQAGVAAGVVGWSTPRVRSVDAQATAGSPPPQSTTTPSVLGEPITPPDPASNVVLPRVVEAPNSGGGILAFTGAELGQIAAAGAVAVGVGEAVRRTGVRKQREVEAEAEAEADAERRVNKLPAAPPEPA